MNLGKHSVWRKCKWNKCLCFLENIVLDLLFIAMILKHLAHANGATSKSSANLWRMGVLVQFIWIGNTGRIESFDGGNQCPKGGAVSLSNDVFRNSVTSSVPSSRNLTSNCATELEGFGNEDAGALLELGRPLPTLAGPDVALVTVLEFELLRLGVRHLDRFEMSSTSWLNTLLGS